MGQSVVKRTTAETQIEVSLVAPGSGVFKGDSGIGFLDHMIHQIARHGQMDIEYICRGDLLVDPHHTVEDLGICIGKALAEALGDKKGIARYGSSYVPMDEALARVVLDISGRVHLEWRAVLSAPMVGQLETECVKEFFRAVAQQAGLTLHMELLYGENTHHCIEALFKAFGKALKAAMTIEGTEIPSTKGMIE